MFQASTCRHWTRVSRLLSLVSQARSRRSVLAGNSSRRTGASPEHSVQAFAEVGALLLRLQCQSLPVRRDGIGRHAERLHVMSIRNSQQPIGAVAPYSCHLQHHYSAARTRAAIMNQTQQSTACHGYGWTCSRACDRNSGDTARPSHSTSMRPLSSKYAPAPLSCSMLSGARGGSATCPSASGRPQSPAQEDAMGHWSLCMWKL